MRSIRSHLTFANVVSVIALFIALGGTALASVIITSNSQVAKDTISGHKPATGKHSNIITGSVNGTDLANQAVTAAKIGPPEAWHVVAAPSGTTTCSNTDGVFCTFPTDLGLTPWKNFGGGNAMAAFYTDQLGIVHLKGLVVPPDESNPQATPQRRSIFRLPAAYRPQSTRVFASVGQSTFGQEVAQGRVDVQSDGYVVLEKDCVTSASGPCSADIGYLTLDGIAFRPTG